MICRAAGLLGEGSLSGLEETHVVADGSGLVRGGAEGEGTGEFSHHLQPALLAVLLLEDVLLAGGEELQALGRGAAGR